MKKRTAMVLSFAVGILLFTSTALAEIAAKSGYDQAKDALKVTADSFTGKLKNYTVDMSVALKDNGNTIFSENTVNKYDVSKNACENTATRIDGKNKSESTYYRDKSTYINFNSEQGIYYVTEHNNQNEKFWIQDPFKQKEAGDLERIADALVGNLKDYVVVNQNSDGSKELSGTLGEAQIPALVNAVVSYQFKKQLGFNRDPNNVMPVITQDVFVKEVKGKMTVDKNGLLQSILGTGIISGKDANGKEHSLTFELLGKVSNIGSTVVNKPDLKGKKVQKNVDYRNDRVLKPELYIGTYKNNIIIEKDNKLVKIGERIVEITKMDDKSLTGKYHENYIKGYEDYSNKVKDLEFNASFTNDKYNVEFDYQNESGKSSKGHISLPPDLPHRIYFDLPMQNGSIRYDGEFNRVFE